jgi:hypothetical protein
MAPHNHRKVLEPIARKVYGQRKDEVLLHPNFIILFF